MLRWQTAVDFAVLACALNLLFHWARRARALRIALAIVSLYAAGLVAGQSGLFITGWVLHGAAIATLALLVILFQPEVRAALMQLDGLLRPGRATTTEFHGVHSELAEAAFQLAGARKGALIVLARKQSIAEIVTGGIRFGAEVSRPVLEAIFEHNSPLHDGAAVVFGNRIVRVGAVLPLTERQQIPDWYGTRHRAALGLAERTDSIVVVVSEERGTVTVMYDRSVNEVRSPEDLVRTLDGLVRPARRSWRAALGDWVAANPASKIGAVALAGFITWVSVMAPRTTIRTVSVPIEFTNVPAGLAIQSQSATRVEVQLRGSAWEMDSLRPDDLVLRFDLKNAAQGMHTLRVDPIMLNTPSRVVVERFAPGSIVVNLAGFQPVRPG